MSERVPNTAALSADTTSTSTNNDIIELNAETDWWSNAIEEDSFYSPLSFDSSDNGLWNGRFVPPPPRPPFIDESVVSDGLTTCDLCTWAWHERNAFSLDDAIGEAAGEIGWVFILIIVSVISAILGAIIMVFVLRCRRKNSTTNTGGRQLPWWSRANRTNAGAGGGRGNLTIKQSGDSIRGHHSNSGVWTWLSNRSPVASPNQIGPPSASPAENHYTHMDDAYSPVVDDTFYAELDHESIRSVNPSYQNTAYSQCELNEQDIPIVSSAPSSAYYSDLSTTGTTSNERGYEIVGLTHLSSPLPNWESDNGSNGRHPPRLEVISELTTMPSDYV